MLFLSTTEKLRSQYAARELGTNKTPQLAKIVSANFFVQAMQGTLHKVLSILLLIFKTELQFPYASEENLVTVAFELG